MALAHWLRIVALICMKLSVSSCYVHIVQSRPRHLFPYEIYGMFYYFAQLFRVLTTARHSRTVLVNYFSSSHIPIFRRKCE